jgi:hypothetical protein
VEGCTAPDALRSSGGPGQPDTEAAWNLKNGLNTPGYQEKRRMDDWVHVRYKNTGCRLSLAQDWIDPMKVIRQIEGIRSKLADTLGGEGWHQELAVEIFQDREDWIENHTAVSTKDPATWIQGDSGRVIRVVADKEKIRTMEDLLQMIAHECVHHLIGKVYAGGRLPAWLDEGLAMYFSKVLPESFVRILKEAAREEALIPFELLEKPFTLFDRKTKKLAYAQSGSLIYHLILSHDFDMVTQLLAAAARNDSLDTVLKQKGLNLYLLEKEWKQWIHGLPE